MLIDRNWRAIRLSERPSAAAASLDQLLAIRCSYFLRLFRGLGDCLSAMAGSAACTWANS